jgi:hypothetical protein|nr:MAG TPA: hypothetical protein [Caudoviricetes sp.]
MICATPIRYIDCGEHTVCDIEFDAERHRVTVRCKDSSGRYRVYVSYSTYLYREFKEKQLKSGDTFHVQDYYHKTQRRLHLC